MMPPGSSTRRANSIGVGTLRLSPPQILQRHVADHERDAHREQHLRQVVFAGSADQEAVDQIAQRDDRQPAAEYAEREASGVAGDRQADIAAEKVVGAVRHIDDAHQPEGEREAAGEQEQQCREAKCR